MFAERLREQIKAQVFNTPIGKLSVTMSFGLAMFPGAAADPHELLVAADKALYHSKQTGRDRITVFSNDMGGKSDK